MYVVEKSFKVTDWMCDNLPGIKPNWNCIPKMQPRVDYKKRKNGYVASPSLFAAR